MAEIRVCRVAGSPAGELHHHRTALIGLHYHFTFSGDQIHYYYVPYCRIGPYLVGVAVGWLLVKMRRKQTRSATQRMLMTVGWLVAADSALAVLYSPYGAYHGTTFQTESENVLYMTVGRTVWGMALGWVVVACYYGYGGVVDIILSWDAWVPLSRLTYCAYMVHILVMYPVYLTREVPIHYSTVTIVSRHVNTMIVFCIVDIILNLPIHYSTVTIRSFSFKCTHFETSVIV
ncbi:nose resistant to fluoxetine protein 6-like isoform X1 [Branchiostoma lanceolatum]|uniref:nose resistant to fluoxetine protein 6-like isoform X1 n=1 Tax=Branchiostoma lanceolatum TaxID=7740 RepID=UPI0034524063